MSQIPSVLNVETLCWIARLGSFQTAAQRMNTTQPAVSARMKELEQSLGFKLFEKRGRAVVMTIAAREFVEKVEPLIETFQNIVFDARNLDKHAGTVRMGVGEASIAWFNCMLPHLQQAMPEISFDIDMDLAVRLRKKLLNGHLDLAVMVNEHDSEELRVHPLGETRFVWVASASLFQREGHASPMLFQTAPVWCVPRDSGVYPATQRLLRQLGGNPAKLNTCNRLSALVGLLEHSEALAHIPEMMVREKIASGVLVPLPTDKPPEILRFSLATHAEQGQRIIEAVVQLLLELTASVPNPLRAANEI